MGKCFLYMLNPGVEAALYVVEQDYAIFPMLCRSGWKKQRQNFSLVFCHNVSFSNPICQRTCPRARFLLFCFSLLFPHLFLSASPLYSYSVQSVQAVTFLPHAMRLWDKQQAHWIT